MWPLLFELKSIRGTWVVQLVKHPALDFGSGHDLSVHEIEPHSGLCIDGAEPARGSLFLCPSPDHTFSFKVNKRNIKKTSLISKEY